MKTVSKAGALVLGATLALGLAGCKNRTDQAPAPVTTPEATAPTPAPPAPPEAAPLTPAPQPATPPVDSATPPLDTTQPPASGLPANTAPDKVDHKDPQRDRHPAY